MSVCNYYMHQNYVTLREQVSCMCMASKFTVGSSASLICSSSQALFIRTCTISVLYSAEPINSHFDNRPSIPCIKAYTCYKSCLSHGRLSRLEALVTAHSCKKIERKPVATAINICRAWSMKNRRIFHHNQLTEYCIRA
jgi:hypothetical protein